MNDVLKRFTDSPWVDVAPGAKEKRFADGNQTIRLVQFAPPFEEIEPCTFASSPQWITTSARGTSSFACRRVSFSSMQQCRPDRRSFL